MKNRALKSTGIAIALLMMTTMAHANLSQARNTTDKDTTLKLNQHIQSTSGKLQLAARTISRMRTTHGRRITRRAHFGNRHAYRQSSRFFTSRFIPSTAVGRTILSPSASVIPKARVPIIRPSHSRGFVRKPIRIRRRHYF